MSYNIKLKDSDVLTMDEETGDITVPVDKVPLEADISDIIIVQFAEDPETIQHQYTVEKILDDEVTLSWTKQMGESLLEFKLFDKIAKAKEKHDLKKAEKTANKKDDKTLSLAKKLLNRDIAKGQDYKFFLQTEDGKHFTTPMDYKTVMNYYPHKFIDAETKEPLYHPSILNAIVVNENNNMVRKGMQDMSKTPFKMSEASFKLNSSAAAPWTNKDKVKYRNSIKSVESKYTGGERIYESMTLVEEPVIKLSGDELTDPSEINFRNKIKTAMDAEKAEQERQAAEARKLELREKHKEILDDLGQLIDSSDDFEKPLSYLFDKLVPKSGKAETVAGELVRAAMRLAYRYYNDGDKFYEGYGIDTCASSANYLRDFYFTDHIDRILNKASMYSYSDDAYETEIHSLAEDVVEYIEAHPELLEEENTVDSRDYDIDYIVENQPRYEYTIEASDTVARLVDEGILNAWDLNEYVEQELSHESVFDDVEVDRPFSHSSTEVSVSNLTADGLYEIEFRTKDLDSFWESLAEEYMDQLDTEEDEDEDEE